MAQSVDQRVAQAIEEATHGRYVKRQAVGRGAYGEVWLIERLADNVKCVAKVMQAEKQHRYEAEVQCLISCRHFSVIGFVETVQSSVGPVIILEYADGGDLSTLIKNSTRAFDEAWVGTRFVQLILALHHIHVKRMMHRDIKCANILLTHSGLCKLSDFGFSRLFDASVSQDVADTFLGTPYYLAPELWKRQKYSKKADIWSLGVVLYEMMSRKRPFVSANMRGLMNAILSGEFAVPEGYSPAFVEVLHAMLQVDPARRPSTHQLLMMPVVREFARMFLESVSSNGEIPAEMRAAIGSTVETQLSDCAEAASAAEHPDDEPEERVLLEGPVLIGSLKEWKSRYITLTDSALVVTRVREDKKSQKLEFSSIMRVAVPQLPEGSADDPTLMVVHLNTGFTVWIKCATAEERDMWINTMFTRLPH